MPDEHSTCTCIVVEAKHAKTTKDALSKHLLLHDLYKVSPIDINYVAIPINYDINYVAIPINHAKFVENGEEDAAKLTKQPLELVRDLALSDSHHSLKCIRTDCLKKATVKAPLELLRSEVKEFLRSRSFTDDCRCTDADALKLVATKYELYGDLVLFTEFKLLLDDTFTDIRDELIEIVLRIFKVRRIAVKSTVQADGFRTPCTQLVTSAQDGWVTHVDDGIRFAFDITRTMFSKGNISEKLRVAAFDCRGEVVVDLFAGIGYFTLPYLIKAGATRVIACEWNPDAIEALRRNLLENHAAERCAVLEGDNREVCPHNVADRVNLGLIPTSEASWKVACAALKSSSGGWMHVHTNLDRNKGKQRDWREDEGVWQYTEYCKVKLRAYFKELHRTDWLVNVEHVECVKSYGPNVDHLVLDVQCRPPS